MSVSTSNAKAKRIGGSHPAVASPDTPGSNPAPASLPEPAASPLLTDQHHVTALVAALERFRGSVSAATAWGQQLAEVFTAGGRLLAAGNGGSAAQAQHLTAELVGRYRDDRMPFSAIALHAETSSTTAIANDYDWDSVFARQVRAHGRPGDVLVLMSTSGRSPNMVAAAEAGQAAGLRVWSLTGPVPNPLADRSHQVISVEAGPTATVQEIHLVAVHLICAALDVALGVCTEVNRAPAGIGAGT